MTERIRYLVHGGTVQGVNFRASTAKVGRKLSLVGFVRNVQGAEKVEGEVQGDATAIKEFLKYINDGPSLAHVVKVEHSKIERKSGDMLEKDFENDRT